MGQTGYREGGGRIPDGRRIKPVGGYLKRRRRNRKIPGRIKGIREVRDTNGCLKS